jgi:hypothetical protein
MHLEMIFLYYINLVQTKIEFLRELGKEYVLPASGILLLANILKISAEIMELSYKK